MRANRERGTAAAEMAILLLLYVFIIFCFLFLGIRAVLQIREQTAGRYALSMPGVQTTPDVRPFLKELREEEFRGSGRVTRFVERHDTAPLPSSEEIREALVEETFDPAGHFFFDWNLGIVRFRLDPTRLAPLGRYILRHRLTEVAPDAARTVSGWLLRSSASLRYRSDVFGVASWLELPDSEIRPLEGESIGRGARSHGRHDDSGNSAPGRAAARFFLGRTHPAPRQDVEPFFDPN